MQGEEKRERIPAIEIRIEDRGIGIPKENWDLVFEAFYQVDSSSTREHDGTGLGLSIVKQFVEAHGGRVWVEDRLDGESGARFVIELLAAGLEE